jgi:ribonuclease T1
MQKSATSPPKTDLKWQAIAGSVILAIASALIWYWTTKAETSTGVETRAPKPPVVLNNETANTNNPVVRNTDKPSDSITRGRKPSPSEVRTPPAPTAPVASKAEHSADDKTLKLSSIADEQQRQAVVEVAALIDKGGPFRYRKDGTAWENRERRLNKRPPGYYREYTVDTPGENDRGARRIIAGDDGDLYYTADHYRTFVQIR